MLSRPHLRRVFVTALLVPVASCAVSLRLLAAGPGASDSQPATQPAGDPVTERMLVLWRALTAGNDPQAAAAAVDSLADGGDRTVRFVLDRLARSGPDRREVARRIAELDSPSFQVRDRATSALRAMGLPCAGWLRQALAESKSAEVKARINLLLAEFSGADAPDPRVPLFRGAIVVLTRIGSDEARRVLTEMVVTAPDKATRAAAAQGLQDITEGKILAVLAAAKAKRKAGDLAAAAALCERALALAVREGYRGVDQVRDVRDYVRAAKAAGDRLAELLRRAPADGAARRELMWLRLVERGEPGEAAKCLPAGEASLEARRVRLAAADVSGLSAEQALEMAKWYERLADDASLVGQGHTLSRARACYERYLAQAPPPAVAAQRALAIVQRRLARVEVARNMWIAARDLLTNGGFEELRLRTGWPAGPGLWGGDHARFVEAVGGIRPHEGTRMLQFGATGFVSPGTAVAGQVCQLIDLKTMRHDIRAGHVRLIASARFNRVAGGERTDTLFGISLYAYAGSPETHWQQKEAGKHLLRATAAVATDADPATWQPAQVHMLLPKGTDFVTVEVQAVEDVHNDTAGPEFDGHFADSVFAAVVRDE